ncbi:MAG: PP2C family protein-serine/threonine phosphatase [Anaerolineae bacterium]
MSEIGSVIPPEPEATHEPPAVAETTKPGEPSEQAGYSDEAGEAVDEGLTPLPAGTLLADRYEIVELMSSDSDGNVYTALDLACCSVCGFEENAPADEYCADCGAALSSPPTCQIRERPELTEPETVARFNADGRAYLVLVQELAAEAEATEPAPPQQIRLRWGARTHPGLVRALNEDYLGAHVYAAQGGPTLGLLIVADGVGGQAAGEVASQLATQVIWEKIRETVWLPELHGESVLPETMETRIEEAVQAANQAVYRQRTEQGNDMGTTVTLALLRDSLAVIANVGDSRTYLWNAEGLQQLTVDHSLVQSLIDAGELEPDDIYTHSHRHIIHRSIGDRPRVEIDTFVHELAPGDRLILCSDGLWEMARDEGIEEILLLEPDPRMACDGLVELANLAGGSDNISVIIVAIEA